MEQFFRAQEKSYSWCILMNQKQTRLPPRDLTPTVTKLSSGCVINYPKEHVRGWYHTMDKKPSFGELSSEALEVGDLVEWSTWNSNADRWNYNYGIITEIKNEIRTNRMVSISKVMPMGGNHIELEHFSLSLRLVSRSHENSYDDS